MQLENVWVNLKLARELGLQRAILYGVLQEHMQEYDSKKGMEKQLSVYADELGVCESSIKKWLRELVDSGYIVYRTERLGSSKKVSLIFSEDKERYLFCSEKI